MIRQSPSGAVLPQYTATFLPVMLTAFSNVIETVTVPGVVPGQNVIANFNPLPSAALSTQAWVTTAGQVKVQIYNASNVLLNLVANTVVTIIPV
jgi:hypothetical protein